MSPPGTGSTHGSVSSELLRSRRKLIESQAAERNRLLKLLETANIKLASVASDVFGVSGRAMLKALIEGNSSAEEIAALPKGQLRRKRAELVLALDGRIQEHHRFLLAMQLRRLEAAASKRRMRCALRMRAMAASRASAAFAGVGAHCHSARNQSAATSSVSFSICG